MSAGRRAAPPEDLRRHSGLYHLVEALSDEQHPDHADLREWPGGELDADSFRVDDINDELSIHSKSISPDGRNPGALVVPTVVGSGP